MSTARSAQQASIISDNLARSMQSNLSTAAAAPQKILEANLQTGSEFLSFVSRRLQAQAELWNGLGHCRDVSQLAETQKKFWEGATKDYSEELNHFASAASKNLGIAAGMTPEKGAPGKAA
jgi:Phasin protein